VIQSKFITVGVGGAIPIKGNSASCNLIPTENEKWVLIDAGYGCARNISEMGIPFGNISEIIITHYHNDHFSDLPTVLFAMFMSSSRTSCDVYVPPEDLDFLETMLNDTFQHLFQTINMATGKTVNVNFIGINELKRLKSASVEGVKVQHGNTPTYGLVVAYKNSTIGFSSDTA
jgi:ribonuclease Z